MEPTQNTWYQEYRGWIIGLIILILVGFGFWWFMGGSNDAPLSPTGQQQSTTTPQRMVNQAYFSCASGKSIAAVFYTTQVVLKLSDGRSLTLSQAIAASGARYTNLDESVVFWNKGIKATLEENKKTTYAECTEAKG